MVIAASPLTTTDHTTGPDPGDPSRANIIVGMSGGVDSSVAALILKHQGYQVRGIFMQNWEDDDEQCTARQDYRDASAVADLIGIELSTVNFAEDYWQRVFTHFLDEYRAGRTPNPDILCNREIKFKAFLDHARLLGADAIATGHYAQCAKGTGSVSLLRGSDRNKDQSYFLHALDEEQLTYSHFPIGHLDKTTVRQLAHEAGIHVHSKKDSTGICFIGERKFRDFLAEYLPAQPGQIVSDSGDLLGQHNGLMYYTLGQRQGLGIGGKRSAAQDAWYVLAKNLSANELVVGQGHDHPALLKSSVKAHGAHWINQTDIETPIRCTAKVRYRQQDQPCSVHPLVEGLLHIQFDEPVRAATPGQSIVFYDGERCMGGAVISEA